MGEPVLCPGDCGTETEMLTLRYGAGITVDVQTAPAWCTPCLNRKTRRARSGAPCHCAEIAGVHEHEPPEAKGKSE